MNHDRDSHFRRPSASAERQRPTLQDAPKNFKVKIFNSKY